MTRLQASDPPPPGSSLPAARAVRRERPRRLRRLELRRAIRRRASRRSRPRTPRAAACSSSTCVGAEEGQELRLEDGRRQRPADRYCGRAGHLRLPRRHGRRRLRRVVAAGRRDRRQRAGRGHGPGRSARPVVLRNSRPSSAGYHYIETRDGTLLAINVILPGPLGERAVPDRDRVLRLRPGQPRQPAAEHADRDARSATPPSASTCAAPAARAAPSSSSRRCRATDGYDVGRGRSPRSRGCRTTRSAWSASRIPASASSSSRSCSRRTWPRSRRCRSIADTGRGTLYPGGIFNNGFATDWAERPQARRAAGRPGLVAERASTRATRSASTTRSCAARRPTSSQMIAREPVLHAPRSPTRSRRRPSWTTSRCRCSSPAPGRTSRPAATSRPCSTASPAPTSVHFTIDQRRPHRAARRRRSSRAGSSSSTSTSRERDAAPPADRAGRSSASSAMHDVRRRRA